MPGNAPPRIYEAASGMINSIGLQNMGVREFVREKLPGLRGFRTAILANVFGYAVEDYVEVVRVLENAEGVDGYELNVSCPNTRHGGMYFSSDEALLGEVQILEVIEVLTNGLDHVVGLAAPRHLGQILQPLRDVIRQAEGNGTHRRDSYQPNRDTSISHQRHSRSNRAGLVAV